MATPSDAWQPNRKLAATVVDTEPPPPSAWPRLPPLEPSPAPWPTTKKPQRTPPRLGRRQQPAATAPAQRRSAGGWIALVGLCALAAGLFLGPTITTSADRAMELGMGWLAPRAPSFLRPYLPAPMPKPIEPRARRPLLETPPPVESPPVKEATPARSRRHK
jgi:hypothetical protein